MPKFKVESPSKHSPQETYQKIKSLLENDKDLRKMDANYVCHFDDSGLTGTAKGGKFEAAMKIETHSPGTQPESKSGSQVVIEVTLPLMLTPLKGVVQSTLQKKLEHVLG